MREIKFRAWEQDTKKMLGWDTLVDFTGNWMNGSKYYIQMQFTGLKDKKGKEIYEGDIVRGCLSGIGIRDCEVKQNPTQGWYPLQGTMFNSFREDCEVIGNIYENPNLLTSNL